MVYFRPHQPKHSPQTFPLQPNRPLSDKHPKIAKALQITGVVLAALALIALIGCVAAVSAGAAIPLVVIGSIAATTGLLSAAVAVYSAKKALALHKQKQLTDTLPLDTGTEHVQYLTTDKFQGNQWDSLDALVKQFSQIDLTIRPQEKKLLQELFGSKYDTLSQTIEEIPVRFSKTLSLLRSREQLYRGEERHDRYLNSPLSRKNRLLIQITSNMIRLLPQSGGIFSIKANTLSKTSHKLYTIFKVALSLSVIAAVACLVIFLPPSLPFIIVIGLAALALGVATFLMARGIRYLLERSSTNRKQLAKNIREAIGPDVLASMVHYQHQLLSNLHETLLDEAITARWNQPLFIQHADLELQLEELTKQYDTLATAFEQALREDELLRAQLEKRAYRFPSSPTNKQEETIESQQTDSENDSDFQEIINKGLAAAKKRREESQKPSKPSESESAEEGLFSIWKPTKNLELENLWQAEAACTEEQQAILLEDYMSQKTLECKAALQKISQELHEVQKSFVVQERHALTMSYESSLTMMDLARANQETYRLLNILSELQQLAQYLLDR